MNAASAGRLLFIVVIFLPLIRAVGLFYEVIYVSDTEIEHELPRLRRGIFGRIILNIISVDDVTSGIVARIFIGVVVLDGYGREYGAELADKTGTPLQAVLNMMELSDGFSMS